MANEKTITIEPVKQTILRAELIGSSDLILCKKSRSYERSEVWKQTHPKGSKMPSELAQEYSLWEHLITSITWRDKIEYHDDDYSLYTEDEWKEYMENNAPCILSSAFFGAMNEAFITFGFKEKTGRAGTDFKRSINFTQPKFPITFASATYEQKLIPNSGINKTNVVGQYNIFSGWRCEIELTCADIVFPEETVIELISTTGQFIGIGTQRKNGFGHWTLGSVDVIHG